MNNLHRSVKRKNRICFEWLDYRDEIFVPRKPDEVARLRKESKRMRHVVKDRAFDFLIEHGYSKEKAGSIMDECSVHHIHPLYAGGHNSAVNMVPVYKPLHVEVDKLMRNQLRWKKAYSNNLFLVFAPKDNFRCIWHHELGWCFDQSTQRPTGRVIFETPEHTLG